MCDSTQSVFRICIRDAETKIEDEDEDEDEND